jgi:hypothetical protein
VAAVAAVPAAPALVTDENGQIDLFSWRQPKREMVQIDLFPE